MSVIDGVVIKVKKGCVGIMLPTTQIMFKETNLQLKPGDKVKVTINFDKKEIAYILGEESFDNTLLLNNTKEYEWIDPVLDLNDEVLGMGGEIAD